MLYSDGLKLKEDGPGLKGFWVENFSPKMDAELI